MDTLLYEYLIVISPPEPIKQRVKKIKEDLNKLVPIGDSVYSQAHITLNNFMSPKPLSEKFAEALQNHFGASRSFPVKMSGYDRFINSNTVYAAVQISLAYKSLYRKLSRFLREAGLGPRNNGATPHMTIAKNIAESDVLKLLALTKHHRMEEEFNCDGFTVLEKKHQEGVWNKFETYKEIKFDTVPDLFSEF